MTTTTTPPTHHSIVSESALPTMQKRRIIQHFIDRNFLVSEDLLEEVTTDEGVVRLCKALDEAGASSLVCLSKDIKERLSGDPARDVNWTDFESTRAVLEITNKAMQYKRSALPQFAQQVQHQPQTTSARRDSPTPPPGSQGAPEHLQPISSSGAPQGTVGIITIHEDEAHKREVQDFISFFNHRYKALRNILQTRRELSDVTSINRLATKGPRSFVAVIGIVADKAVTRNENIILTIEDPTGAVKVLAGSGKPDIAAIAKECVLDEVVGIAGTTGDGIIFADSIILPDVPVTKELKKSPDEVYAIFLSDVHVGSNNFLASEFNKFLQWIRGKAGSDAQRETARKVKYVFIVGDLVDGIGIYPGQEKELAINDIYKQYEEFARLISLIPQDKHIIICPGNHDAVRLSEPQPRLDETFAKPLYELKNVMLVSNPAYVNIHKSEGFPGFDVLMYHGYSFDHFVANIDTIRAKGGYDRIDLLMTFLLQRRHLAPTHTSTLYIPDAQKDPLVIDMVPDIFATGHIHKAVMSSYRNITLISGSCWQATTAFQEKVGHKPEPARVPLVDLHTRQMKMMRFSDD